MRQCDVDHAGLSLTTPAYTLKNLGSLDALVVARNILTHLLPLMTFVYADGVQVKKNNEVLLMKEFKCEKCGDAFIHLCTKKKNKPMDILISVMEQIGFNESSYQYVNGTETRLFVSRKRSSAIVIKGIPYDELFEE